MNQTDLASLRLGFLGTGKITTALVTGFLTGRKQPRAIVVSPRGAERAAALNQRFSKVTIAIDNQAVIDSADVLFLALRPETAAEALSELTLPRKLPVVSLMPTLPSSLLRPLIARAEMLTRAVPLPSAAMGFGPILTWAPNNVSRTLMEAVGEVVEVENEHILHGLWTVNGMISPVFDMMAALAEWARTQDVPASLARQYTARFVETIARTAVEEADVSFAQHSHDAATPGGLNEQSSYMLSKARAWAPWQQALDAIRRRFPD